MNKQQIINKLVNWYEKAEHNIKNADKFTLWVVIGLLILALMFQSASKEQTIIVNIPKAETISPIIASGSMSASNLIAESNSDFAQDKLGKSVSNAIKDAADASYDSRFKYCLVKDTSSSNPWAKSQDKQVLFVIDEAPNKEGIIHLKSTIFSDYVEGLVSVHRKSWFDSYQKLPCTPEMIENNTREKIRNR